MADALCAPGLPAAGPLGLINDRESLADATVLLGRIVELEALLLQRSANIEH